MSPSLCVRSGSRPSRARVVRVCVSPAALRFSLSDTAPRWSGAVSGVTTLYQRYERSYIRVLVFGLRLRVASVCSESSQSRTRLRLFSRSRLRLPGADIAHTCAVCRSVVHVLLSVCTFICTHCTFDFAVQRNTFSCSTPAGQVRSGFSPVTRGPNMGTSTPNTQAYGPSGPLPCPLRKDLHTH